MLLHLTQTFLYGAYKGRREVLWISGLRAFWADAGNGIYRLSAAVGPEGIFRDDRGNELLSVDDHGITCWARNQSGWRAG